MSCRLVTRLTIEERMMQQTKKKMVLEHLVVHKMNTTADLKQVITTLGQSSHICIPALVLHGEHAPGCHILPALGLQATCVC